MQRFSEIKIVCVCLSQEPRLGHVNNEFHVHSGKRLNSDRKCLQSKLCGILGGGGDAIRNTIVLQL